ncbi:MAG: winged helix-turn-helix transcriptional regulator [Candidatus Thermoplasmatota archaeon]|jgi:predicted transcriptional regulator|nr:winged helix-turn-helix transcriptional regulator [Candidatus Thermoplasmatota archaeon]
MSKRFVSIVNEIVEDASRLERHFAIIEALSREGTAGIIRLSNITNLPVHKVRYSLRVLENSGIIEPTPNGAMLTESFKRRKKSLLEDIERASVQVSTEFMKLKAFLKG